MAALQALRLDNIGGAKVGDAGGVEGLHPFSLGEPRQHFVEGAGYADYVPTVELDHRFIPALVGIVDDRDGLLPDSVPSAVDPSDQDEPTSNALPLDGHLVPRCCPAWRSGLEQ